MKVVPHHSGICKCSQQDGLEKRSVRYKFNDGQVLMLKLHRARSILELEVVIL